MMTKTEAVHSIAKYVIDQFSGPGKYKLGSASEFGGNYYTKFSDNVDVMSLAVVEINKQLFEANWYYVVTDWGIMKKGVFGKLGYVTIG